MSTTTTTTEDRALQLLGAGVPPESVANALGVSPSRISQLLSDETFKEQVILLRYENLQKHNARDNAYDGLEDELLIKLRRSLPMIIRPAEILKALQVINAAKRRGQSAPESTVNQATIVNITLPAQVVTKFVTNVNNQVIKAGEQELITIQSGQLLSQVENKDQINALPDIEEKTS